MVDIAAARAAIQRAVSRLVNRFGHESDVFADLTEALANLEETPVNPEAPQGEGPPVVVAPPEAEPEEPQDIPAETETTTIVEPIAEPEPEQKPRPRARRRRSR
jgi:outer membrane biosynthesis protein TonB